MQLDLKKVRGWWNCLIFFIVICLVAKLIFTLFLTWLFPILKSIKTPCYVREIKLSIQTLDKTIRDND